MATSSQKTNTLILEAGFQREESVPERDEKPASERLLAKLRLLWMRREFLWRSVLVGFIASTLIAFLIPKEYMSSAQLMPPDSQSGNGLAMVAALAGQTGGGLGSVAGDLLGIKTSGALFIAVMRSHTVEDRIIQRFDLKKAYGTRLRESARGYLSANTGIVEDRKSGVLTLSVQDRDPKRAAGIAGAYIDELDALMTQLNTSSAHRERVFLEGRLGTIKGELEFAEKDFSQFASKNEAIDISAQGKAMLEGAATLQGELIAAESQLEGLRQIYSDNNVRIRSLQARVSELRSQQLKLDGKYGTESPAKNEPSADNSYPTLRELPILGVPYADKFRKLKVEEAIFETLTKQYEVAKVQEAKEIPSVKVLDPPEVPERRFYPPRLQIIVAGTLCAFALATIWIFGALRWSSIDGRDPGLIFAREVLGTVRLRIPWAFPKRSERNAAGDGASEVAINDGGSPRTVR
jgi:capsule polysaccharide export protein KpsE/RkpR